MDRRDFLRHVALGAGALAVPGLLAACRRSAPTSGGEIPPGFSNIARDLDRSADPGLDVLLAGGEFLRSDRQRITLGLVTKANRLFEGMDARLWLGREGKVDGPLPLTFHRFAEAEEHGHNDAAPATGFYDLFASLPDEGVWDLLVHAEGAGQSLYGFKALQVGPPKVPPPGTPAVAVPTPTFDDARGVAAVCTREPPCPMHAISLDTAVRAGKPTVLVVATPKFCLSRMCGPTVNEVVAAYEGNKEQASFVHAEVFRDPNGQQLSPTMEAWHMESEPWTMVIDASGTIRERFEGPVVAAEVTEALQKVL
jgi:hypothetical protein